MMPKISVTIITYNAQRHLKKVLDSIKGLADEIIIVDSGSIDKTKAIAKAYNAKFIYHKWPGFAKQKNFAIEKAKNNWILSLDADEIVPYNLEQEILSADYDKLDCFYISRKNYYGNHWVKGCGFHPDWQLRLFRKDKTRYLDMPVHEQVKPVGNCKYFKSSMIHYTYIDDADYLEKIKKYTTLDAQVLFDNKRKWSLSYQIGKPIKEFFSRFISQKGYEDGYVGFKVSIISAYSKYLTIVKLRKLYEKENSN